MKCPHCLVEINSNFKKTELTRDVDGTWSVSTMICPSNYCKRLIIRLESFFLNEKEQLVRTKTIVRPLTSSKPLVSKYVDKVFADDYKEACLVLPFSPKASAALSRRCLQHILRSKAGVKKKNLASEIQEVIDSGKLPSYISESIDAIRNIGNYAAHPIKSTSTGGIVEVEPGEAEWLLNVLETLFDFYFVQPAILKAKKDALNKKLADIGKPQMKG